MGLSQAVFGKRYLECLRCGAVSVALQVMSCEPELYKAASCWPQAWGIFKKERQQERKATQPSCWLGAVGCATEKATGRSAIYLWLIALPFWAAVIMLLWCIKAAEFRQVCRHVSASREILVGLLHKQLLRAV